MTDNHPRQLLNQIGHGKLHPAQAHAQHHVRTTTLAPGPTLRRALLVDPTGQAIDQPGLLEQGNEQTRRHIPDTGMTPAQQGLETAQAAIGEGNLRLIDQAEIPVLDRIAHAVFEHQP
ncbi:hypothetical protein D3C80_1642010 [compost metagenome]